MTQYVVSRLLLSIGGLHCSRDNCERQWSKQTFIFMDCRLVVFQSHHDVRVRYAHNQLRARFVLKRALFGDKAMQMHTLPVKASKLRSTCSLPYKVLLLIRTIQKAKCKWRVSHFSFASDFSFCLKMVTSRLFPPHVV